MKLHFNGPINSLSLGNVSMNFLKELWKRNAEVSLFPVGDQANFQAFDKAPKEFIDWIKESGQNRFKTLDKKYPVLKNWHINGSENRIAPKQFLYTYYEVSSPTQEEIALVKSQEHVFFSSSIAANIFKNAGCDNVSHVPLGFDEDFHVIDKKFNDDVIHFGLIGKFERRKNTRQIIQTWLKKYGNDPKYLLTCLVNNPFFTPEQYKQILQETLGDKEWTNINFLPSLDTNSEVLELMNAIDIDLSGFSNGEGWNMGAFNTTALGKWSVVSNCSSHKDWATEDNSILVEPVGEQPCYDNFFFRKGLPFNQGNYFLLSEDSLIDGMERAVLKAKTVNTNGLIMGKQFTYKNTVDQILTKML